MPWKQPWRETSHDSIESFLGNHGRLQAMVHFVNQRASLEFGQRPLELTLKRLFSFVHGCVDNHECNPGCARRKHTANEW